MSVMKEPREPGQVAFEVEVVPHFAMSNGQGWEKGTGDAAHVARTLRYYADLVEGWAASDCEVAPEGYYAEDDARQTTTPTTAGDTSDGRTGR